MATVTVGCGAGFAGDRPEPAVELARSGRVGTVVLECLAERTLVGGLLQRRRDPGTGYDPRLRGRLEPLLGAIADRDCRVVSNLGSANPLAAGEAVVGLAREMGLPRLRVAAVLGDDIAAEVGAIHWSGGAPDPAATLLGAHAYLGVGAIAEALADGADVVLTGRTSDSALFAAPAVAFLDLDLAGLAGATTAGHLLECSGQLTGGNLTAGQGRALSPVELADLGYPLAEIRPDGTSEISVLPGKPARLDRLTVTLQLLYEVHDPRAYLTPDVTLDFTTLQVDEVGPNRVRVSGVGAAPAPETLKAVGFLRHPGLVADMEIAYAGEGAPERARRAGETLAHRLGRRGIADFALDHVGVDSVLGAGSRAAECPPAEVRLHVSARCASKEQAQAVEDELYALTLAGPAGGCCLRSERRPHVEVVAGTIERARVTPSVAWCQR